jgi:hypothetical protein
LDALAELAPAHTSPSDQELRLGTGILSAFCPGRWHVTQCEIVAKLLRQDLLELSQQWIEDARILSAARRFAGAYHSGGVALECVLKAKIAKSIQAEEFPDKRLAEKAWGHDPAALLKLGELERSMDQAPAEVQTNWATVKDWTVDSRYNRDVNPVTVTAFLEALDDPRDGILPWLRSRC